MKNKHCNITPKNITGQLADRILLAVDLAVDAHANFYVVSRKIDSAVAQAPKRIYPYAFVAFAEKQKELGREIHVVYEAGCFGFSLGITKAGHTRIRTLLIELAWRFVRFQPNCPLVKKWQPQLEKAAKNKCRRKQIIVAIARQLAIDI